MRHKLQSSVLGDVGEPSTTIVLEQHVAAANARHVKILIAVVIPDCHSASMIVKIDLEVLALFTRQELHRKTNSRLSGPIVKTGKLLNGLGRFNPIARNG